VILSTDSSHYIAPSQITLTLFNGTETEVNSNLCFAYLERLHEGTWTTHPTPDIEGVIRDCPLVLMGLSPGESRSYEYVFADPLPPDTYRFCFQIEWIRVSDKIGVTTEKGDIVCTPKFSVVGEGD